MEPLGFFIKAVSSGIRIDTSSLKRIRNIIKDWDIEFKNPYIEHWIQKHAPKLLLMALDLEAAWNFIEEIGLRKKLMAFAPQSELAILLSKEPLRSAPSSFATPLRIKGSRIDFFTRSTPEIPRIVSHATRNIEALESIRRHPFGKPNFFVSRWNQQGETAVDDEGLYTAHGTKGWGDYTLNTELDVSSEANPILRDTRAIFQSAAGLRLRPFRSNRDPDYLMELLFNSLGKDLELERINKKFKRAIKYHTNTQELLNKWAHRMGAWLFENPARVSLLQSWIAKNLKDIPLVKILETLKATLSSTPHQDSTFRLLDIELALNQSKEFADRLFSLEPKTIENYIQNRKIEIVLMGFDDGYAVSRLLTKFRGLKIKHPQIQKLILKIILENNLPNQERIELLNLIREKLADVFSSLDENSFESYMFTNQINKMLLAFGLPEIKTFEITTTPIFHTDKDAIDYFNFLKLLKYLSSDSGFSQAEILKYALAAMSHAIDIKNITTDTIEALLSDLIGLMTINYENKVFFDRLKNQFRSFIQVSLNRRNDLSNVVVKNFISAAERLVGKDVHRDDLSGLYDLLDQTVKKQNAQTFPTHLIMTLNSFNPSINQLNPPMSKSKLNSKLISFFNQIPKNPIYKLTPTQFNQISLKHLCTLMIKNLPPLSPSNPSLGRHTPH